MTYKPRIHAKTDKTQSSLVEFLRKFPYIHVETGHDDLIIGTTKSALTEERLIWVEWKSARAISKKTGEVLESEKKDSQKKLERQNFPCYIITGKASDIFKKLNYHVADYDDIDTMFDEFLEERLNY